MYLSVDDVDALIAELEGMQIIQKELTDRRKVIRESLDAGRHEGTYKDLRMSAPVNRSILDRSMLQRYVTSDILEHCTRRSRGMGNVVIVAKPKRNPK